MKNNPESVSVWFVPHGTNEGWNLKHGLQSGGPHHYPVINVGYNDTADLTFHITNQPGVTFAADPVWVGVGMGKPSQLNPGLIDQIQGATTRDLSFHDPNGINPAVTLTYVLRFSNGTSTDPIIQNGGCCRNSASKLVTLDYGTLALYLLVAFVFGLAAMMGVRRFRRG